MAARVFVEIVRVSDGHVDRRIGPMGERSAMKVMRGALINLNTAEWLVRFVNATPEEPR